MRTIFVDQVELLEAGVMILNADGQTLEIADGEIEDGCLWVSDSEGEYHEQLVSEISCIEEC